MWRAKAGSRAVSGIIDDSAPLDTFGPKRLPFLSFSVFYSAHLFLVLFSDRCRARSSANQFDSRWQRKHSFSQAKQTNCKHGVRALTLGRFWSGRRAEVWEEKLGIREKFAGNEATEWGTLREEEALCRYKELTGHEVEMRSFKVLGDSVVTSWLGASPDGLVLQPPTAGPFLTR